MCVLMCDSGENMHEQSQLQTIGPCVPETTCGLVLVNIKNQSGRKRDMHTTVQCGKEMDLGETQTLVHILVL